MNISVIVPVYNSRFYLADLVSRLQPVLESAARDYELILVNDGSKDQSWNTICDLASKHKWIRGVDLMRNYGQHNALLCGIRLAKYETIVTMDDDLQHPPEEIPKLLEELNKGFDVVYGPPSKERHSIWRIVASKVTKWALQAAMGAEVARNVSAFRAFRTQVRNAFYNYQNTFVSIDVMLTWGTDKFAAVPVRHDPRKDGTSNYTFYKLFTHALNMATGFSTLPLQLASILGFVFTGFGIIVLLYVVVRYLIEGGSAPGFPFLASIIAVFSGVQLFAIGIIGEYLARIHYRSMGRPSSVIRDTTDEFLLHEQDGEGV